MVVGGDGLIGRAAAQRLRVDGWRVTPTTRRPNGVDAMALSMEQVAKNGPPSLKGYDAVVIAAAITNQAECESHPEIARLVNVEGPRILARAAMDAGTQVVFLSTNLVLGGNQPFLGTTADLAPVGAYARMKAEAEKFLQALPGAVENLAVLRLTKVLDAGLPLLATWRNQGAVGKAVAAFNDLVMAPVSLSFAAIAITRIVQGKCAGVFHCSGDEEVIYSDFARAYLRRLGMDATLVRPVAGRALNQTAAASPPHASLAHDDGSCVQDILAQPLAAVLNDLVHD